MNFSRKKYEHHFQLGENGAHIFYGISIWFFNYKTGHPMDKADHR